MLFKQLYEPISSTYTYLLGCEETGQALLIDPVLPSWERDLQVIQALDLKLACTIETHIHADHITSANKLREITGSQIAMPALDKLSCSDIGMEEGKPFTLGSITMQALHTPGHTDNHMAYIVNERVFTGDVLLIDGCGRTDFQNGDAETLYHSVHDKLFTLPEDQLVYPAHDYQQRRVSSIGQEKTRNQRLGDGKTLEQFVQIMHELKLEYPKFIDHAVPGNKACGLCPPDVPENLQHYCEQIEHSKQG